MFQPRRNWEWVLTVLLKDSCGPQWWLHFSKYSLASQLLMCQVAPFRQKYRLYSTSNRTSCENCIQHFFVEHLVFFNVAYNIFFAVTHKKRNIGQHTNSLFLIFPADAVNLAPVVVELINALFEGEIMGLS